MDDVQCMCGECTVHVWRVHSACVHSAQCMCAQCTVQCMDGVQISSYVFLDLHSIWSIAWAAKPITQANGDMNCADNKGRQPIHLAAAACRHTTI